MGSGLGGAMLAAILARRGLSVLMLEAESHPRFTIGEATTPDTNFRLKHLGLKFDVPEIVHLSAFHPLRDHVSPASGVKRAFSFLYQREGVEQDPLESHQYPTLAPPMGPDCHFFRQDTDAYMMATAVKYGADIRQQTRVIEIDIGENQVTLTGNKGEVFRGSYLVDGTGFRSVLADRFKLRDDPSVYRTNSRAIFTHMVGVEHYDEIGQPAEAYKLKYPLSQSTLHHIFEGGWMWMIAFNNHADAINPLCSVGLVLNREIHPETGKDPEEEFFSFVNKFPAVARQFSRAKAVRNWVSTTRLQYGSSCLTGHRYCLLSHAAGFIDPLFSSGLVLTTSTVDLLAAQILKSFETNDFAVEKFQHIDEFFQTNVAFFDRVVGNSFLSFRDYELWDAWFRIWVVGLLVGTALNGKLYLKYLEKGDPAVLDASRHPPHTGVLGSEFKPFRELFEKADAEMQKVRSNSLAPKEAARRIRELFRSMEYFPDYFRWYDPSVRTTPAFTAWGMTKMYFWYLLRAPRPVFNELFGWKPHTAYLYILGSMWKNSRLASRRNRTYIRDVFKAWNTEWKTEDNVSAAAPANRNADLLEAGQKAQAKSAGH